MSAFDPSQYNDMSDALNAAGSHEAFVTALDYHDPMVEYPTVEYEDNTDDYHDSAVYVAEAFDAEGERVERIIHETHAGAVEDLCTCVEDAARYVVTKEILYAGAAE